jgi:hypothetical protein
MTSRRERSNQANAAYQGSYGAWRSQLRATSRDVRIREGIAVVVLLVAVAAAIIDLDPYFWLLSAAIFIGCGIAVGGLVGWSGHPMIGLVVAALAVVLAGILLRVLIAPPTGVCL